MQVVVVHLSHQVGQDPSRPEAVEGEQTQHFVGMIYLDKAVDAVGGVGGVPAWDCALEGSSNFERAIDHLWLAVLGEGAPALPDAVLKQFAHKLLPSQLQTHPGLMLVVHLHVSPQVPAHM